MILCSEYIAAEKNRKILLRIRVSSFIYFFCVGIPILKIVLLHAHKWVTYDVIL